MLVNSIAHNFWLYQSEACNIANHTIYWRPRPFWWHYWIPHCIDPETEPKSGYSLQRSLKNNHVWDQYSRYHVPWYIPIVIADIQSPTFMNSEWIEPATPPQNLNYGPHLNEHAKGRSLHTMFCDWHIDGSSSIFMVVLITASPLNI